ncbi:MAG: DegT/DnrJ/EryC1/StrS family aminotransferase [Candidatus Levyibacteriota bacterium]
MTIFNSLGSNYDNRFVQKTLRASNKKENATRLKHYLEKRYAGEATLVYKGREAIRLALRAIARKGSAVGICGFTCFAVYEAIVKEGYSVVYFDIDQSLNYSLETVKKMLEKHPEMKVLLIQNTLGYPAEGEQITKFCREKGIVVIEDLAHCIGTTYKNGKEAGTVGDFVILSFSQDKVIDGISGGALVIRNKEWRIQNGEKELLTINSQKQQKDRYYPWFTWMIRKTYRFGFGKVLHFSLKKMKLLQSPMDNQESDAIHKLPNWNAELIYQQYTNLAETAVHRNKIATIYAEHLEKNVLEKSICNTIDSSANLRFPIFVEKRDELLLSLKKKNIYISDTWYDAPIGPKKYLSRTDYKNQCPNAEVIATRIVNLPTHRNVSEKDAIFIVEEINQWFK